MKSSLVKSMTWMSLGAVLCYFTSTALEKRQAQAARDTVSASCPALLESKHESQPKVERLGSDTVFVPEELAHKIGLHISPIPAEGRPVPLPSFHGVLALDNDYLSHVRARFGGEVVEIGSQGVIDGEPRPIRVGDRVSKGQLLAVVWSTELGAKKIELMNSLSKLRAEEDLRDRLKKLATDGGTSGRSYRDAEKDVQTRLAEIANTELTLRTWRLCEEDITRIHREADRLTESQISAADLKDWARVEIRAPISGIVLEKNIAAGALVDTSSELFKIGDTSHLSVWAHVYEEDLPLLESLPQPIAWKVSVPSRPGAEFDGSLDRISAVIDPAQHTALVTGRVENESGALKVGQFVTVSIELPPNPKELELPVTSLVEDGRDSVVFIENTAESFRFSRHTVQVVRRYRDKIYIKAEANGVQSGMRIVSTGALMVKNAMEQLAVPAHSDNSPGALSSAQNQFEEQKVSQVSDQQNL